MPARCFLSPGEGRLVFRWAPLPLDPAWIRAPSVSLPTQGSGRGEIFHRRGPHQTAVSPESPTAVGASTGAATKISPEQGPGPGMAPTRQRGSLLIPGGRELQEASLTASWGPEGLRGGDIGFLRTHLTARCTVKHHGSLSWPRPRAKRISRVGSLSGALCPINPAPAVAVYRPEAWISSPPGASAMGRTGDPS